MMDATKQNPYGVVMVRPVGFSVNTETAADNHFQADAGADDRAKAVAEFDTMVAQLRAGGITVHVFEQAREDTPDAVFPNNWFSTHADGTVVTYPMFAPSRRRERRDDLLDALKAEYAIKETIDLTAAENNNQFLEGTGAIVFDHVQRIAYMARSQRANEYLLDTLCERIGYSPFAFDAVDAHGRAIYHTNVMMAVGEFTALVGFETVTDKTLRDRLRDNLSDRTTLALSQTQISKFAGNALELESTDGPLLVLSAVSAGAIAGEELSKLLEQVEIIHPDIPTIEKSGGSVRCMMAGIHLPRL